MNHKKFLVILRWLLQTFLSKYLTAMNLLYFTLMKEYASY